jgi:ribose-phosphate pyrophosphokinase
MKKQKGEFLTPEHNAHEQTRMMESARGHLLIASCRSGAYLANKVVKKYDDFLQENGSRENVLYLENIDRNFSDSETTVCLDIHISGYDVFLFQALLDPSSNRSIDQNYIALYLTARTLRENGANHVTAVLPYLAYARQDKPTKFRREPTAARLMADLAITSGVDRLIVWDPHCGQIRGFYGGMPVHMLDSLTLFIDEFRRFKGREDVIAVAPDVGAGKFVTHFGQALGLKYAIAAKERPEPEAAVIKEIIGDFRGKKTAVILDDMVSGGKTLSELCSRLVGEKGIKEIFVGISHNLCIPAARGRLEELHKDFHLKQVVITNSIPQTSEFKELSFIKEKCLSEILARTINRIHYNRSVSEVFYRP